MSMIDDIKRDQKDGTPGPWRIVEAEAFGDRSQSYFQEIWNSETDILVTTEVTRAHRDGGRVNMRRIARVPQMEAALLAAEEMAAALEDRGGLSSERQAKALAAYRAATGGAT